MFSQRIRHFFLITFTAILFASFALFALVKVVHVSAISRSDLKAERELIQLPSSVQSELKYTEAQQFIEGLQQTSQGIGRLKIYNPSQDVQRLILVFHRIENDAQAYAFFSSGISHDLQINRVGFFSPFASTELILGANEDVVIYHPGEPQTGVYLIHHGWQSRLFHLSPVLFGAGLMVIATSIIALFLLKFNRQKSASSYLCIPLVALLVDYYHEYFFDGHQNILFMVCLFSLAICAFILFSKKTLDEIQHRRYIWFSVLNTCLYLILSNSSYVDLFALTPQLFLQSLVFCVFKHQKQMQPSHLVLIGFLSSLCVYHFSRMYTFSAESNLWLSSIFDLKMIALTFAFIAGMNGYRCYLKNKQKFYELTHDPISHRPNRNILSSLVSYLIETHKDFYLCTINIPKYSCLVPYLTLSEKQYFLKRVCDRLESVLISERFLYIEKNKAYKIAMTNEGCFSFILLNEGKSTTLSRLEKMIHEISMNIDLEQFSIKIEPKMGVSCFPVDSNHAESLINKSFQALDEAIQSNKTYHRYDSVNSFNRTFNMALVNDLKNAIKNDALELYFQPQISLHQNHIHGYEVLLRWNHPKFGFISPDIFIKLAEEVDLINELTLWVLEQAFMNQKKLMAQGLNHHFSVNISAEDICIPNFVEYICQLSERYQVPRYLFSIELTESSMVSDFKTLHSLMIEMLHHNIDVSIDDYGTGYSSMSYLSKLPFSELKIDREFVKDLLVDLRLQKIVKATTEMSKNIGLQVVAEGVENAETIQLLKQYGVDICQGFYYAKPLPLEDYIRYVRKERVTENVW